MHIQERAGASYLVIIGSKSEGAIKKMAPSVGKKSVTVFSLNCTLGSDKPSWRRAPIPLRPFVLAVLGVDNDRVL